MISGASSPRVGLARTSPRTRNCCPRLLGGSTWSSKTTHSHSAGATQRRSRSSHSLSILRSSRLTPPHP